MREGRADRGADHYIRAHARVRGQKYDVIVLGWRGDRVYLSWRTDMGTHLGWVPATDVLRASNIATVD